MEHLNLQKRSALHHKRALHFPRAEATTAQASTPSTTSQHTVPPSVNQSPTGTTSTTSDSALIPAIITRLGIPLDSTTQQTSSVTTAPAVPLESSVTTSSLSTTSRVSSGTRHHSWSTPSVVVQTTTAYASSSSQSPSATAQASSGTNAGTIIGGVAGALGGTILLTVIIGFVVRRWRKRKAAEEAFDASQFKRGAIVLDEDDNPRGRPRPPTMIERRNMASTAPLLAPSTAYPYSDQPPFAQPLTPQGTGQSQYRPVILQPPSFAAGYYDANSYTMDYGQGQGDPFAAYANQGQGYEEPGYGAPPIPGAHGPGTYAAYGIDPRYPQHRQQFSPPQYQQGFDPSSPTYSPTDTASSPSSESFANHPFSPTPLPEKMSPAAESSSNAVLTRGASVRQSTQSYEAPPAYINNDVSQSSSSASFHVTNPSSDPAEPNTRMVDTKTSTQLNGVHQS